MSILRVEHSGYTYLQ